METKQVYDDNAAKWLRTEPSSLSDFTGRPFLFDACGNLEGRSVLDIGCGEGYCARELKRRGAGDYLGIDLSEKMIAAAQYQENREPMGIAYQSGNVADMEFTRQFDLCIAVFLFNYLKVSEMHRVFANVYSALNDGGQFIFSVPHPFFPFVRTDKIPPFYFDAQGKNYFTAKDEQFEGEIWKRNGDPLHVQCVHKTLGDYFTGLRHAGFTAMPEVSELTVTADHLAIDEAFFSPLLNQPLHMLFKVGK